MKLVTPTQSQIFLIKAQEFVKSTGMFGSCSLTSYIAVAEYMAQQENLTIFQHLADEDKDD